MLHTNGTENDGSQVRGFGAEIQAAVKTELELILAAPAFAQSSRCKKFLSHVVRQSLSGNADQLKERIIGAKVFDRAYDYDTGEDSIVRVTANEVRKRISQFYQESRDDHRVQIDLPRGSYVPEFRLRPAGREGEADAAGAADASRSEPAQVAPAPPAEAQAAVSAWADPASVSPSRAGSGPLVKPGPLHFKVFATLSLLALAAAALLVGIGKRGVPSHHPDIWSSLLHAGAPVLVCLGTHDLPIASTASSASSAETEDVVMRRETIPIDDANVLASMAKSLASRGIPFRLVAAEQTSLTDLQLQPVILIGAVDNQWTLQLTRGLRYRISVDYLLGPDKPPRASIFDAEQPAGSRWTTDFSVPLSAWRSDYAIVARENNTSIGVPVLIEAGLGNSGSLAASDLVSSGALESALASESACSGKTDFEAVIGTDIIGARPGPPHILRLTCW